MQVFAAISFVRRNADILNQMVLPFQSPQVLGDDMGLEAAGTPAAGMGRPAQAPVGDQCRIAFGLVFVEILLEGIGRFQPGDGPANMPLQLFQMGVHLRKLEASVTEEDLINLAAFLQQTK